MSYAPITVVNPITITSAMLISSTVPEADYAAYAGGTTYGLADRVIDETLHKVYESVQTGNVGHDPSTNPTWWIEVSPTNRWKLFDSSNSTQTAQSTSMSYVLRPGVTVTTLGILNATGINTVRVRVSGTAYDQTIDLTALPPESSWYAWGFAIRVSRTQIVIQNISNNPGGDITVDITGTTALAVGVIVIGQERTFGKGARYGARLGIQDYSRKETNDYGDTILVPRAFARKSSLATTLDAAEVDVTFDLMASLRATPCLWIGTNLYASTVVFGYYKDFEITIDYATESDMTIELEGLT